MTTTKATLTVGKYEFDGPYGSTEKLEDRSGVYTIVSERDGKYYVVDVGESTYVKTRVENHDRAACWKKHANGGTLKCAVYYTPYLQQEGRKEIEKEIRSQFNPPCGEQ